MVFNPHHSVLREAVLQVFRPLKLDVVIDGTIGAGGHAQALLETHPEISVYLGIDQDSSALALSRGTPLSMRPGVLACG